MNIIELQDNLKDVSDNVLMREMQSPSGNMPQFLVLSELTRRRRMRDDYKRQQAANMPTVAEEVMTAAGAPQEGLTAIARNMAPNSSIAQNTSADMAVQREPTRMPQMMAEGGLVGLASGGAISVQPTGGGNYILVQNGERVQGTGVYPDFKSADAASRAIRGAQPFQVPRVLADEDLMPSPIVMDEGPSLQEIDPDPTAFAANDEIRRSLQMRQAMGDFDDSDPSTEAMGGFGQGFFDENIPSIPSQADDIPSSIVPDFDATNAELSSPTDATIGSYGRTTVGQTADEIERMNQMLDLAGIGPDTESDVDMIDLMSQAQIEREGFGAGQTDDTSGITTASRRADREKEGFLDFLPTFGSTGEGRGRDYQVTVGDPLEIPENIEELMPPINQDKKDRQVRRSSSVIDELIEAGFTGGDIDPSDVPTQTTGTPLSLDGDIESLMPPVLRDLDVTDNTTIESISGDQGNVGSMMPTGGDSYGALESRIAQMLADREKSAESDKYLALAQAGLALMASDKPTLGAALGEAGLVGISQLREARNQYDKDILGLLSTQADIDAARRDASLAERRLGLQEREVDLAEEELRSTSGLTSKRLNEMIDDNRAYLNTLQSEAKSYRRVAEGDEALGTIDRVIDMTPPDLKAKIIAVSERLQELERMRSGQNVQFDATATQ